MKAEEIFGPTMGQLPFVPHQCNHNHDIPLREATYKELASLIDPHFLDLQRRAGQVRGVNLTGIEGNTMNFLTTLSPKGKQYINQVRFKEWSDVAGDMDWTPIEAARMLIWEGNVELYCSCPAFLYWGFQYLLTAVDASIYPEDRKPSKNNPQERGIVCKHLYKTLKSFPFHATGLAQEIKRQRMNKS